jgi:hypothetical protein
MCQEAKARWVGVMLRGRQGCTGLEKAATETGRNEREANIAYARKINAFGQRTSWTEATGI